APKVNCSAWIGKRSLSYWTPWGSVSRHKKAWVLGLLYTITAERDLNPTKFDSVLPSYRCEGPPGCWHMSLFGHINDKRQQALISNWMKWKQEYLDIREPKRP